VALSYAQYAGNGSTTTFSVPFPYILKAHVKLYTGYNILTGAYTSQLVDGTNYNWTSGTQIQVTAAPANGVTLTVLRDTPDAAQLVPWQDGSNLTAADLNNADLQNLYVVQEQQDRNDSGAAAAVAAQTAASTATAAATAATTAANTANATAAAATTAAANATTAANASTAASTQAIADSQTALTQSAQAVSTANTASSNAAAAVSTANNASAAAAAAVNTANNASAAVGAATTTANNAAAAVAAATSAANGAVNTANAANATANTALGNSQTAITTANNASTAASNATTTANNASATANNASTAANNAVGTANAAAAAVANALLYDVVANVAAIPANPANNKAVEVTNSTNIQAFSPLAGLPAGFVGASGLSVRIVYSAAGATWNFIQYFPNDPESRYLKLSGGTLTGAITGTQTGNIIPFYFDTYAGLPSASTYHGAVAHAHDTGGLYYAHGGQWVQLAVAGASAGAIIENQQTINSSYTLSAGYNGSSVGPVTVAAGVSVTVPANAVWAIL